MDITKNPDELFKLITKYQNLGGFPMQQMMTSLANEILKIHNQNMLYMRAILLTNMFNEDSIGFFDFPTVPDLFQFMYSSISKGIHIFQPMCLQAMTSAIERQFYPNPKLVAKLIFRYFERGDPTKHLLFAFSTFPSLYCEFVSEEFCEMASEVIIEYMAFAKTNPLRHDIISKAMILAFFRSATRFYDTLWSNVGRESENFLHQDFLSNFSILTQSLNSSLPHFTKYHQNVFKHFIQAFGERKATYFFVEKIIRDTFLMYKESSPFLPLMDCNKAFGYFLETLLNDEKKCSLLVSNFFNFVSFVEYPIYVNGPFIKKGGLPLLFSSQDIKMFVEIFGEKIPQLERYPMKLDNSYAPILINVYPLFLEDKDEEETIGIELFGEKPLKIDIADNEEGKKIWRIINHNADDVPSLTKSLLNPPEYWKFMKDPTLRSFIYIQTINLFNANYSTVEHSIEFAQKLKHIKDLKQSLLSGIEMLYYQFSYNYIRENVNSHHKHDLINGISDIILKIVGKTKAPSHAVFEICCTALDCLKIKQGKNYSAIKNRFNAILTKWMETEWNSLPDKEQYVKLMKYAINTGHYLGSLNQCDCGKKLKVIIEFQRRLMALLGPSWYSCEEKRWTIFNFAIFTAGCDEILTTFLFIKHFVFYQNDIVSKWSRQVHQMWEWFSTCIWNILKKDEQLMLFCSNPDECHNVFKVKKATK